MSRTNALLSRFSRDEIYSHVSPSNKYSDPRSQSLDTSLKSSKKVIPKHVNEGQQPTRYRLPLNEIIPSQLSYCNQYSLPSSTKSCSDPKTTFKQIFENNQIKKNEDLNKNLGTQAGNNPQLYPQTSKNLQNPSSAYFKSLQQTQQSKENLEYMKKIQESKYSDNYLHTTYLTRYYNSANTTAATTKSNSKKNLSIQPSSHQLLSKLDISYAKNHYNTLQNIQSDSQKSMLLNSSFHSEQNKENRLEDINKISWSSDQGIKQKSQQESYSQWLSPLPISIMAKESQVWRENKNYRDLVAFSNTSTSLQHSHRQKEQMRKASYDFGDQQNQKNQQKNDRDLEREERIEHLRSLGAENVRLNGNKSADLNAGIKNSKMKTDILSNTYDYNSYLSKKNSLYQRENEGKENINDNNSNSSYLNNSFMKVQNSTSKNSSNNNYGNSLVYQNQGTSFGAIAPALKEIKTNQKSYYDDYKSLANYHGSSKNSFERSSDLILNRKESMLAYSQKKQQQPSKSSTPKCNNSESAINLRQKQEEKQLMQLQMQSIKKKKDPKQDSPFMHRHYQSIHKTNNNLTKKSDGNDISPDNATFRQKRASTVSFFGVSGVKSAEKYDDCDFLSGKKTAREVPFGDLCSSQECIRQDTGLENEYDTKVISLSFNQIELENQREAERKREMQIFKSNQRIDSNSNSKMNSTSGNESFFSNTFLDEKDWNNLKNNKNNNNNINNFKQSFCSNQSNGNNSNGIYNNDNDTSRFMISSSVMDGQKKQNNNVNGKNNNSSFMQEMECSMQLFEKLSQAAEEKGKLLERNRELERQLDEEKRKQQLVSGQKDAELVSRQISEANIGKLQESNDLLNRLLKEKLTAIINLEESLKRKDKELKSSQYDSKIVLDKILKENMQLKESLELVRNDKISLSQKLQKLTDNLNEIEAIRKENADLSVSFQEIYQENEKTLEIQKEKEDKFKKELAEKDMQIQRRDSFIIELQRQIKELNGIIQQQKQKITCVEENNEKQNKNQIREQDEKIREFKDKIREQEEKIRELNLQISQQTTKIKEYEVLAQESNNKRKQYEVNAREQQTWRNKAEELENKCSEIDKSYDYLLAEYNRQKSELSICKQKETAYVEQYQQEISGMKQTNLEFQSILNRQVQEINYYKMQVQNLPKQNEHIIEDLNNKLVHLLAENQRLNTIIFQRCKNTWN